MFRKAVLLGIAALVGVAAQDPPAKPPAEDYKDRMAKIKENLAEEHYKIGEYLFGVSMHRWARDEFRKSIGFAPDHAESRKRLGYIKKEGDWEPDPDAALETENKKKGDEELKLKGEYDKRVAKMGSTIAKQWADLGNFCAKNKMKEESEAAWKLAIEYDPLNSESRKKLGYVRSGKDGPWLSPFEAAWRKQAKDGTPRRRPARPRKRRRASRRTWGGSTRSARAPIS
jgi:tetratricopeptide (TPR) repeat protein